MFIVLVLSAINNRHVYKIHYVSHKTGNPGLCFYFGCGGAGWL